MLKFKAKLLFLLIVAVCAVPFRAIASGQEPVAPRHLPCPAAPWEASPVDTSEYSTLPEKDKMFFEYLSSIYDEPGWYFIAPLIRFARQKMYSAEELQGAVESLQRLIVSPRDSAGWPVSRKAVGIYLDPACSICREKLDLLAAVRESCGSEDLEILIRVVPEVGDPAAEAVGEALKELIAISPDDAVSHVQGVMALPSIVQQKAYIDGLLAISDVRHLDSVGDGVAEENSLSFRQQLQQEPVPLAIFRDKKLKRNLQTPVPFDPMKTSESLIMTLRALAAYDEVVKERERKAERRMP